MKTKKTISDKTELSAEMKPASPSTEQSSFRIGSNFKLGIMGFVNSRKRKVILCFVALAFIAGVIDYTTANREPVQRHAGQQQSEAGKLHSKKIHHYVCPMHPQVTDDKPGKCPICGMELVPVFENNFSDNGGGTESTETAGIKINGVLITPERRQLIGIKTMILKKKRLFLEVRASGRVAFDPDLAIAVREYLKVIGDAELRRSASSRLRLLGLGDEEIRGLPERRYEYENLFLPGRGGRVWIYASLYEMDSRIVQPGMEAQITLPHASNRVLKGIVRSLSPVVDPLARSVKARIEVEKSEGLLRPDTYVDVIIKSDFGEGLAIPRSGFIDTGIRHVAFVVGENNRYESRNIEIGPDAGDDVIVLAGLKEGERVVTSAAFLVDSESLLKESIAGLELHKHENTGKPGGEGGISNGAKETHQH